MKKMKVKHLKEILESVDDSVEVVVQVYNKDKTKSVGYNVDKAVQTLDVFFIEITKE